MRVPGATAGASRFTVTGEDVSVLMDLHQKSVEHTAQDEATIATRIILDYAQLGLVPQVIQTPTRDQPLAVERVSEAVRLEIESVEQLGGDVMVIAKRA